MKQINQITEESLNQEVTIKGWLEHKNLLGRAAFITIRDCEQKIQGVVKDAAIIEEIKRISIESVLKVTGQIKISLVKNKKEFFSNFEILVTDLEIINLAKLVPFNLNSKTNVSENIAYQYRYLSLRRFEIKNYLNARSQANLYINRFLTNRNFTQIETPLLSSPNSEGAVEFLTHFMHNNKLGFYSLAQSPQIYKQLLMMSGFRKYFQIVKCFRNEDLRADRQPEFTQLDIEIAFSNSEHLIDIINTLMHELALKVFKYEKQDVVFSKINYDDAINNYGSDSPDLRFQNLIFEDKNKKINAFLNKSTTDAFYYIAFEGSLSKNQLLEIKAISQKYNGHSYYVLESRNKKFQTVFTDLTNKTWKKYFVIATSYIDQQSLFFLGKIRTYIGKIQQSFSSTELNFVWVINWPLFEKVLGQNDQLQSLHHPFVAPVDNYVNLKEARSQAYDITLNGLEVGGGSVRIFNSKLQREILQIIGLTDKEINIAFGSFLEALDYGCPPHNGIALGLDRLYHIFLKTTNIREVIAFPKSSKKTDPLLHSKSNKYNQFKQEIVKIKEIIETIEKDTNE